ncbi:hypothetical protein PMAYCL1PPCAC_09639 [Pristionchus mayeri]|uniref:Uncharacterized protein n=1 Tax=Pristionchus mayeri TaxID=1317129 RepID=A0AAN4ZGC8_9BILA|nr:hypothetical protein PMAYCL1PPCAC_09639 [Pristionchus mayeri]
MQRSEVGSAKSLHFITQGAYSHSMQQRQHKPYGQPAAPVGSTNPQDSQERLESEFEILNKELIDEIERKNERIHKLEKMLIESAIGALHSVTRPLVFKEQDKLSKPLICIQLENCNMLYFDNVKPFELFTNVGDSLANADLKLLEGEYDCSYRGTVENHAYFSTFRGKIIKFFRALIGNEEFCIEQINEMRTTELSLFKNEPLYFIERSKEWSVYQYHENYSESDGQSFDISQIDLLSKYERHYHRGMLYLFRETVTAAIRKVNAKVVTVEGPLLDADVTSFYAPPNCEFIYIVNSEHNVIIILNTVNLTVSQLCYEPPSDASNHTIVGIHQGVITMAFDGVRGRCLSTAKMPE